MILLCAGMMGSFSSAQANSKYAALVIHADTGDILFDKYSTQRRYPASLTKMMTLYLLFEELEAGRLTLQTKLKTSRYAASMPASHLKLKAGDTITVEQAIEALVIKSANDVAVVVAEKIGKTEKGFAQKMTKKAWSMGMRSTRFRNASGLPNRKQYSTARDLAVLSQRVMQDFPQYWPYFQKKSFTWKGKTYKSHNRLVGKFTGADGLKTGYTRMSGYNLATSVTRGDNRLIGIVLGGRSTKTRDAHMKKIVNQSYANIKKKPYLVSAIHRKKPAPNLKPTTLAELGGVWPPVNVAVTAQTFAEAPTLNGSTALQYQLASQAASLSGGLDAPVPGDDVGLLITENMSEAERLNVMTLAATYAERDYAEGDVDETSRLEADLNWSIQTGAYSTRQLADTEMTKVLSAHANLIADAAPDVTEVISEGKSVFRVRFNLMSERQAEEACAAILSNNGGCFVMKNASVN